MKLNKIKINVDQHLTDVLKNKEIPTNTILNKTLTGLGATYSELKSKRNSIIIEPNVPVITGKRSDPKHKGVFGVHEGIYADDVVKYLEKKPKHHKKILTTPESFKKIKDACSELGINIHEEYFLLFDECQKIVQDVSYRSNIMLPIDDFFKFKNKAFVSATPILPSDPRFKKHGFEVIEIEPTFEYKKELNLVTTNSVLDSFRDSLRLLEEYNLKQGVEKDVCVFLNSTDTIEAIIKQLGIQNETSVFCSDKSVTKLKERDNLKYIYKDWNNKHLRKYNFFTSRFYSALDIELDDTIDLFILSDLYYAEHSMVDPMTEVVQIIGRFRNGVSTIVHISNLRSDFIIRTKSELKLYMAINEEIHSKIKNLYETTSDFNYQQAYKDALNVIPFSKYLNEDGTKNYFAIDNYIDEEFVKSSYNNVELLNKIYEDSKRFIIKSYSHSYPLGDIERLQRQRDTKRLREKHIETLRQLKMLNSHINSCDSELLTRYRDELHRYNPFLVEAYELLGAETIVKLNYSRPKINEAMIRKSHENGTSELAFQKMINNSFQAGKTYTKKFIKEELKRIYSIFNIKPKKAITARTIERYFHSVPCTRKKEASIILVYRK